MNDKPVKQHQVTRWVFRAKLHYVLYSFPYRLIGDHFGYIRVQFGCVASVMNMFFLKQFTNETVIILAFGAIKILQVTVFHQFFN